MAYGYKQYLLVLFGSLALSIGLQMLLPFPYGLATALAIFILLPLIIRRRFMNRATGMGRGLFGPGESDKVKINYVCLTCNHRFKGATCPRCGGKMKRAEM